MNLPRPWHKGNHPGLILARRLKRKASQIWLFATRFDVPLVEPLQPALAFTDDLRLETAGPVPRHGQVHRPGARLIRGLNRNKKETASRAVPEPFFTPVRRRASGNKG